MNIYHAFASIITLAVIIGYINYRYIKLQSTIAIMLAAMMLSTGLLIVQHSGASPIADHTTAFLNRLNLPKLLLEGMLSVLLFAGSLSIDFNLLKKHQIEIGTLASLSTIASTLIIGTVIFYLLPLLNIQLPYLYCLLFGALISPTDPIAVLATFKQIKAPHDLEICVAGESLFNDGVAIVIFLTLYQLTFNHTTISLLSVSKLFLIQSVGGIVYGLLLGFVTKRLLTHCDGTMAILITVALVTGGYHLALLLNISGPLAMVIAGIMVGNMIQTKPFMSTMHTFWEVIDELLNAILFLLLGLELLIIKANTKEIIAAILMIPLVLLVRLVTVAIPMKTLELRRAKRPYLISILTWGGLRGGLAVALALSLPSSDYRGFILTLTYAVVAFAVIIQGITIKPLARLANHRRK